MYGEGDAADRLEVQRHLDECAECRTEISGLRSVREDLLAWDVPEHQSVWRPFVAAPVIPWWKQVPAWALATAAGVMLLIGAAGGAVVHAFVPDQTMARQSGVVAAPAEPVLTAADLSAAEQRILARLQQEVGVMGDRVQQVSSRSQSVQLLEGDHNALAEELVTLRSQNAAQVRLINSIYEKLDQMKRLSQDRHTDLEQKINDLRNVVVNQLQLK
jgi:hypothetical protein